MTLCTGLDEPCWNLQRANENGDTTYRGISFRALHPKSIYNVNASVFRASWHPSFGRARLVYLSVGRCSWLRDVVCDHATYFPSDRRKLKRYSSRNFSRGIGNLSSIARFRSWAIRFRDTMSDAHLVSPSLFERLNFVKPRRIPAKAEDKDDCRKGAGKKLWTRERSTTAGARKLDERVESRFGCANRIALLLHLSFNISLCHSTWYTQEFFYFYFSLSSLALWTALCLSSSTSLSIDFWNSIVGEPGV